MTNVVSIRRSHLNCFLGVPVTSVVLCDELKGFLEILFHVRVVCSGLAFPHLLYSIRFTL